MTNAFLNAQEYANTMLYLAKNQLVTGRLVDGRFKGEVTDENGLIINVKRPPRFVAGDGAALQTQDIVTGSVNVAVNQYKHVHLSVGDLESVQSFNALMKNSAMKSAAQTLASSIDSYLQGLTLGFHGWASNGTLDATHNLTTVQDLMPAHTRLMENGTADTDLAGTVLHVDGEKIRGAMLTNFTPGANMSAIERTRIPVVSEIDWYATQQVPTLTTGTRSSTAGTLNGGTLNVNYRDVKSSYVQTVAVTAFTGAATLKKGEVFTVAGVYAWDWRANGGLGAALPYLQQFTLTADAVMSGGSGNITFTPPIIVQGTADAVDTKANTAFATVDSVPATNAALTFVGAPSTLLRVRAAWQKQAISLVSARLQTPFTGVSSFASDPETGIAIRYWRGSDITTGQHIHRWDTIFGGSVMDPFMGTRIGGH